MTICDPFKHYWVAEYYGYRCPLCDMLIPFGCEPWIPAEDDGPDRDSLAIDDDPEM